MSTPITGRILVAGEAPTVEEKNRVFQVLCSSESYRNTSSKLTGFWKLLGLQLTGISTGFKVKKVANPTKKENFKCGGPVLSQCGVSTCEGNSVIHYVANLKVKKMYLTNLPRLSDT